MPLIKQIDAYKAHLLYSTLRKLFVSTNTSSRVGQNATVFSILSLFNYPLNEADCPPVSTYILSDHALWRHLHSNACSLKKLNAIRGIDTVSRVEKLPNEHDSFSQWYMLFTQK